MNVIEFKTPFHSCLVPVTHPASPPDRWRHTNLNKTWAEHAIAELRDDYELVQSQDWLDRGFK
jgi:hypothetical protein